VIALGGATDWLDGTLARRSGRTRLGRDLDTTADIAFFSAAAIAAHRAGRLTRLGAWAIGARHAAGLALSLTAVSAARGDLPSELAHGALCSAWPGLALCAAGRERRGRRCSSPAAPCRRARLRRSCRRRDQAAASTLNHMDEDAFNMSVRKFLKKLGVTSQREIEAAVREQLASGALKGDEALDVVATVSVKGLPEDIVITGSITLS